MPDPSPESLLRVLADAPRGSLAVLWFLPARWNPGEQSDQRQRLESCVRAMGWEPAQEIPWGEPLIGVLHLYRRRSEEEAKPAPR